MKIPHDKILHMQAGTCLALAAAIGATIARLDPFWYVALAPLTVGILKELNDLRLNMAAQRRGEPPPHGVEVLDALATGLPGFLLAAVIYFWSL